MNDNPFTTASDLIPKHEPNTIVFDECDDGPSDWSHTAFLAALGGPVPDELLETNPNTPLLRWSDGDVPAVGLLDALINPPTHRAKTCDRCGHPLSRGLHVNRLWVPGGQSAVELQFCPLCHDVLNDVYRNGGERLLVWS